MKRTMFSIIALAAMTLTSCNNGSKTTTSDADSAMADTAAATSDSNESGNTTVLKGAPANIQTLIKTLNERVKAKDGKNVALLLADAQTKLAEMAKNNPEEAKNYITALQTWLKDNAASIQTAVAGAGNSDAANAVAAAMSTITKLNPENVLKSLSGAAAKDAQDAGSQLMENAKNSNAGKAIEQAKAMKAAVEDAPGNAKAKAAEAANKATRKANEAVNKANEKANKAVNDAADKALKA
ncbi:hypothetical protein [Prevotella dentasini]|uniref:hypothetical protein n=1 Tax=Prevotella dentasini TaxID=589537 RepID=UPI000A6DE561|nr:hypothetical protein [Prevotella dentasini]